MRKLLDTLRQAPPDALYPVRWIVSELEQEPAVEPDAPAQAEAPAPTWRTLLWTCPAETRIGAAEVCEAFGRPRSWLYRHTSAKPRPTIPCRKMDGELSFLVGELRHWAREREAVLLSCPMDSAASERGGLRAVQGKGRVA